MMRKFANGNNANVVICIKIFIADAVQKRARSIYNGSVVF